METVNTGTIAWFDFPTKDESKAMAFYQKVLNWNFTPMGPDYWMIMVDNKHIGGLRKESIDSMSTTRNAFICYFTVPSVHEAKMIVEKCGGKLVGNTIPITDGEDGYFQNFTDLDGNLLSLWSKKP
jgi:predicted enzyme related to lactoylglutathione lyase